MANDWEDDDQSSKAEHEPWRPAAAPATRLVVQFVLAAVALLLLAWLGYVLGLSPQRLSDHSVAGLLGRGAWIAAVLSLLGAILLAEIVLLEPVYARLFRRVPHSLPVAPDTDNYIVGCPGCGTVFTVTEGELEEGGFACHNCGRPGYVKDHKFNRSAMQKETCRKCGNTYVEYLEHSECPVCHTFNQY